jgi:hypothetical protein
MNKKQPVTQQQARQIEAAKAAARTPLDVRRQIQREALASQHVTLSELYYSRVRFQGTCANEGAQLRFPPGKRYAFGYQLGEEVAGHAEHSATYADTNLLKSRQTNHGQRLEIYGIAIRPTPLTDAYLLNLLDMFISITIRLDSDNIAYLGNPSDVPGSAQIADGPTWTIPPPAEEYETRQVSACTKGVAEGDNMLLFKEPLIWTPSGAASQLDVQIELHQQVEVDTRADRTATDVTALGAADNAVVTAWENICSRMSPGEGQDPPDDALPGLFVDYFVKLFAESTGPRSPNR